MKGQVNVRVSDATRAKLDWLAKCHGTQAEAVAVAIDRMYREERSTMKIKAAAQIDAYTGPDWFVKITGDRLDKANLADLNERPYEVLSDNVLGWGEYNAIIRVEWDEMYSADYLARLA